MSVPPTSCTGIPLSVIVQDGIQKTTLSCGRTIVLTIQTPFNTFSCIILKYVVESLRKYLPRRRMYLRALVLDHYDESLYDDIENAVKTTIAGKQPTAGKQPVVAKKQPNACQGS
jgi:hypothetical protein